jgi:hypothetical protein
MSSEQIQEGQLRISLPARECEDCRRLLDLGATSFELKGITGYPGKPLALINGHVLAPGEEALITVSGRKVRVKCIEIRENSVSLRIAGKPVDLDLSRSSH